MPAVTRKGDLCSGHGAFMPSALNEGSPNVFINGLPCGRLGDSYTEHTDGISYHGRNISSGSSTVFANGIPVARVGDSVSCGSTVAQGSPNVNAN